MFHLIVCVIAGVLGSRMGRTGSGWGRVIVSALVSATAGLAIAFTLILILASLIGIMPTAEDTIPVVLKALGLGIFFGGLMARNTQIARRRIGLPHRHATRSQS
jgi:hypothetical protein